MFHEHFPKCVYSRNAEGELTHKTVHSDKEQEELGGDWYEHPNDIPTSIEEVVCLEEVSAPIAPIAPIATKTSKRKR